MAFNEITQHCTTVADQPWRPGLGRFASASRDTKVDQHDREQHLRNIWDRNAD